MTIYTLFLKTEIFMDINVEIDGDIIFQTSEYRACEVKEKIEQEQDDCCPRSDQVLFPIEVVLQNIVWPCRYIHCDASAE